jgi:hypothetical protein
MGLFSSKKLLGTIMIKFYGEDEASVEYKTDVLDNKRDIDLMQLFTLYYAKILFNLNRGEHADQLILYVEKVIKDMTDKSGETINRINILATGQKLIKPKTDGITKKYSGELYEKSNKTRMVQTHMDMVGEGYYSPVSTVMFLQYLINELPEKFFLFFLFTLKGMNEYYQVIGDYSKIGSLIKAPNHGYSRATQILNKIT